VNGLTNKVVVIVGGATGIGEATVRRMSEEGSSVVIGDINDSAAQELSRELTKHGRLVHAVHCDVSNEDSVHSLFDEATRTFGGVDCLHNVAADMSDAVHGQDSNIVDIDLNVWDRQLAVGLRGALLSMRTAIPLMLQRGGGAIVNTSSIASFKGEPLRPSYGSSKAGLNSLTRHVAQRWGREGIRCNAVAPGLVDTPSARASAAKTGSLGFAAKNWDDRALDYPSGRLGLPSDIAAAVAFLLSDDASWINGQLLSVDGGLTMR
jgi:NAD(P)-dependent dehydrogenase (short-subunit alcohol dehydrogenase family)